MWTGTLKCNLCFKQSRVRTPERAQFGLTAARASHSESSNLRLACHSRDPQKCVGPRHARRSRLSQRRAYQHTPKTKSNTGVDGNKDKNDDKYKDRERTVSGVSETGAECVSNVEVTIRSSQSSPVATTTPSAGSETGGGVAPVAPAANKSRLLTRSTARKLCNWVALLFSTVVLTCTRANALSRCWAREGPRYDSCFRAPLALRVHEVIQGELGPFIYLDASRDRAVQLKREPRETARPDYIYRVLAEFLADLDAELSDAWHTHAIRRLVSAAFAAHSAQLARALSAALLALRNVARGTARPQVSAVERVAESEATAT